jgi:hypothetical protein
MIRSPMLPFPNSTHGSEQPGIGSFQGCKEHAGNKPLSNLGVGLDNVDDKPLMKKDSRKCVVGPGGLEPPTKRL